MSILKKISIFLLFAVVIHSPLMGQKKLALANECYNAKAYYLASRYYQEVFGQMNDCHPDQLKMAQALAATQQLVEAESVFDNYMSCQKNNPKAHLAYGKFLMDIQAYEKAIPYFERAMEAEPQLARHYILACQTALPKPVEKETRIFVNQAIESSESSTSIVAEEPMMDTLSVRKEPITSSSATNAPNTMVVSTPNQKEQTTNSAVKELNLYNAMVSADQGDQRREVDNPSSLTNITDSASNLTIEKEIVNAVVIVQKTNSPYGVRLGTYKNSTIPDLSFIQGYGTVEQKQWNGKIILFLIDFPDRAAAEAAVTIARQDNFHSATLVEKLASGRMKSVR